MSKQRSAVDTATRAIFDPCRNLIRRYHARIRGSFLRQRRTRGVKKVERAFRSVKTEIAFSDEVEFWVENELELNVAVAKSCQNGRTAQQISHRLS